MEDYRSIVGIRATDEPSAGRISTLKREEDTPMILTKSFQIGAVALAVVVASTRVASAQDLSVTIPAKYTDACDLDRADLAVRVVAHNEEIYPGQVARTSSGWLVYDKYERQVLELDTDLRRVRSWGRDGPGPMEYENPVGLGRLDSANVVVVDGNPPSLIVFGPGENEHRPIWRLGTQPQQIVQRCVHDDLVDMLEEAVRIDLGPPFGQQAFNLTTMQDFLPLGGEGLLAIGGLVVRVRGENLRSIERYDSRGVLQQAWQLTGYPGVSAVFDERAPGRMLIWDEDTIDGIQLVEVEGLGVNDP